MDDHFIENDFYTVGKDFIKAISASSSSSVLKKVLYPILVLNPLTKEEENKLKPKGIKKHKKSKNRAVIRENSLPAPITSNCDSKILK